MRNLDASDMPSETPPSLMAPCMRCGQPAETRHLCSSCFIKYELELMQLNRAYQPNHNMIQGVRLILKGLQEIYPQLDISNPHFHNTPHRVARMYVELCQGLAMDPGAHLQGSFEERNYKGMVVCDHIRFTSLCAHHLAIFRGVAHVGYIPDNQVVGLSKINRTVELCASKPQVQEQLTQEIADTINTGVGAKGVAVVIEATHDCVEVRGVKSRGSVTRTSSMVGVFLENFRNCREEFLSLIDRGSKA